MTTFPTTTDAQRPTSAPGQHADVYVEAESFADQGGWVMDQQSMPTMGSPYLLAHGLGRPVADARTTVQFAGAGTYRLWVRTRDWVPGHGPGRFAVRVDGRTVDAVFGVGGDGGWRWHAGGTVHVPTAGAVTLELHDLTGFDGRCDAVCFTSGAQPPPDGGPALEQYRRQCLGLGEVPAEGGSYDLVVAGGGYAGICAAVAAARLGLKVALVHDRPVLGGNASSEVRVGPIGGLSQPPFPKNGDILREIRSTPGSVESSGGLRSRPNDAFVAELVAREPNLRVFMPAHVILAETDGPRMVAVVARDLRTSRDHRLEGALFADCTGDATLGRLAGAEARIGREGADETGETLAPPTADAVMLGCTNYWTAREVGRAAAFPDCPWALRVTEASREISEPKYPPKLSDFAYIGGWNWESGFERNCAVEAEAVRDHNLRAIFGTWDFLKNRAADRDRYAQAELNWVAYITGKRESYRLVGDHVLTEQDITERRQYPDGCVTATWYFDAHFPHPQNTRHFPGHEFRTIAYDDPQFESFRPSIRVPVRGHYTKIEPYPIPFRCFYSRDVANLFMAGRNISATHVALLPIRVMNTTAAMGAMVGRAAFACRKYDVDPRALYERHLDGLKAILTDPDAAAAGGGSGSAAPAEALALATA